MNYSLFLATLVLFAVSAYAHETNVPFRDCHNHEVKTFYVDDCHKNAKSCILKKNRDYNMEIEFVSPEDTGNSLKTRFLAELNGVEFGWPGIDGMDACKDGHLSCPLKKGQKYPFKMNFRLNDAIPDVQVKATFKLVDEHNKVLACAMTHITVADH